MVVAKILVAGGLCQVQSKSKIIYLLGSEEAGGYRNPVSHVSRFCWCAVSLLLSI